MRTALTTLAAATALICVPTLAVIASGGSASAGNDGQVCADLSSGKIDTVGDPQVVTVTVPAGQVITRYCVKAGSAKQGEGPKYFDLAVPVSTLDIRHPSGKAVSHYSYELGAASGTPTPTSPTTAPTTAPPSDAPTGTPTGTPTATPPTADPSASNPPAVDPQGNFDWNWRYADPTCSALNVSYPSNIPAGQSNDINVRVWTDSAGEVTLNYHNNVTTWSGNQAFVYNQHRNWPAGVTRYAVIWTQVAGSNYHFGEKFHQEPAKAPLTCVITDDGDPQTYDVPLAETSIAGFDTGTVTVSRGAAVRPEMVTVLQPGLEQLALERQVGMVWQTVKTIAPGTRVTRVTFPQELRRGTFRYRLSLPGSESVTGAFTGVVTVRVR